MNPEQLQKRIGPYELVEYLTAGGMADLYLAHAPKHEGPIVLKTIQKKYIELTRVVKMFVDEGLIAKALDHPNIVQIFDVGEAQGAYFIAMELIKGRDLLAIARRGIEAGRFLPTHIACAIVAQVCNGLTYAHEKTDSDGKPLSIVHCDMSPGNVVVSFGGTAKIVDFGIARAAIQLRAEDHSVAGKYNYMAPEQIRGEKLDARADLFSLGVILYELTVGRRLFRGPAADVKARIVGGKIPRPTDARPELPPALEKILLRALAVDRDKRYQRARDLRADLLELLRADGHAAGKREVAEYLREIFVSQTVRDREAQPAHDDGAFGSSEPDEEQELALEAPLPGLAELVVDADDPEPGPAPRQAPRMEVARARVQPTADTPRRRATDRQRDPVPAKHDSVSAKHDSVSAKHDAGANLSRIGQGYSERHRSSAGRDILVALCAVSGAVLLYLLLRA